MSGDVSYVGQHGFNLLQNVDINAVDFGVGVHAARRRTRRLPPARRPAARRCRSICCAPIAASAPFSRTGASAGTPTTRSRRRSTAGSATASRLGLNYTLGLSNTGNGRQSGPARPPSRRQLLDPRRSGGAGRAAEGSRPAAAHHQGQRGVGPAEDVRPARARSSVLAADGQRLAAVGDPDGRHRRALQRRLQLRRRRGRQRGRAAPMPTAPATRTSPARRAMRRGSVITGDPGSGCSGQSVRAVQHRGVRGPGGVGVQPQPGPRVGAELSARLLRQDRRSGAGAQLPSRRHAQHPVPDRGVQRVQRRGLQRPQYARCR